MKLLDIKEIQNPLLTQKVDCEFWFDQLNVIGASKVDDTVHVSALVHIDIDQSPKQEIKVGVPIQMRDFETINICLVIPRSDFKDFLDAYLDGKAEYCDNRQYYCGVGGGIYCKADFIGYTSAHILQIDPDAEYESNSKLMNIIPGNDNGYVLLPVYKITNEDYGFQMEHG